MMTTSPLLSTARGIAERAHRGQTRKALGQPYFSHLEAVANLLASHGYTDDVTLAAAYLHDLVEDQPAFTDEMTRAMPEDVVAIVHALTEPKGDAEGAQNTKAERFEAYFRALGTGTEAARRALPISCADKIHNTSSIVEAEAAGANLLTALKTHPGEHRLQLQRLRTLYASSVAATLLSAFDEAAQKLNDLVGAWFPGRAAIIAAEAHLGQFDKGGAPYIFHPMHLAMQTEDTVERTAALLHDVVERGRFTLQALELEGCPESVLRAVDALTRRSDESYNAFIARIGRDRVATRVKLLDLAHNSDLGRIATPTDADRARVEKYRNAADRLRSELGKRNLYVTLTPDSVARARSFARLEIPRGEHVTLAHRVHPHAFDPQWIPGEHNVDDLVDVRVVAEVADESVQVFVVEIDGVSVRPMDDGILHLLISRSRTARSRDANALLARGNDAPPLAQPLLFQGVVEWVDD